jgi:hypothetical protein
VPVDLAADVARIEDPNASDGDHEHGGAEDVTGVVGREDDAAREVDRLVVVDRLDRRDRGKDVRLREEGVIGTARPAMRRSKESRLAKGRSREREIPEPEKLRGKGRTTGHG